MVGWRQDAALREEGILILHSLCHSIPVGANKQMRHGRRPAAFSSSFSSSAAHNSTPLTNILLLASLSKTISQFGTRHLDPNTISVSESLVLLLLRRPSLHPSHKLEFFRWCGSLRQNYKHSACTYSHMLRILCRHGLLGDIPSLLASMKADGVVLDSDTFRVLLEAFIRADKFDSALDILDYMEESGTEMDFRVYDSVLVALVKKKQVSLALAIFSKLLGACGDNGSNGNLSPGRVMGSRACNQLLLGLKWADMRVEFRQVFDKLRKRKGFEFDSKGYNICIYAFGCWGDLAAALGLFKEMKDKGLRSNSPGPDLCTYNSMIHVLCLVGKVNDALAVWEELKVSGHEPDAFTYRILIQGCSKSYRLNDAMKILNEMQSNGFAPDTIVYNTLLDGMFKVRKIVEACQLFEKMVQDGVRASCWTYNILIDGLFKNGRPEAGYTLFCDLKKKGKFVDAVTYSIVILQLCKESQLEEALKLVEEMEERGFSVDLVTITSLLLGFHKQGRWDWTEKLVKHIRDHDLVLDVLKWKTNMESSMKNPPTGKADGTAMFPRKGDFSDIIRLSVRVLQSRLPSDSADDGEKPLSGVPTDDTDEWSSSKHLDRLADEINSTEHSFQPFSTKKGRRVQAKGMESFDVDMVNTFLSIFLAKGKLTLACKLFEIFKDMGVNPVSYTYNSIMSSFVKKGYLEEAWGVFQQMGEVVCPADIATYNLIIQGLGKMGRADFASSVLDQLMKQGGYLDIVMYNTLIDVLGKAGRIEDVNKFLEQMKKSGINPDVVTYNTLIEVHTRVGRLKDAYKFLRMMLDDGCSPNHVTDTILDKLGKEIDTLRYQRASMMRAKKENST